MKHQVFPAGDYVHGPDDIMAVGSFGVLYRALWRPRGIYVALKHVPRTSEAGRKVEAEERGAMLQQQFGARHTGIVPEIYEHGRSELGDYYIAMELLDGRSLSAYLQDEKVSHEEAARIARWIAGDFLASLHAFRGGAAGDALDLIVYSDLKPDHIFMLRDGSLRALDFGITKRVQQAQTSTVNPWASVPYASPRRLREGVVDRDADFWALGVILYEMVAGHHLYPGLSAEAMSRAIERQDPPAPLPPCDVRLGAIIRKLLAPQRHESYQTAEEIAADLQAFLDGGTPAASAARISTSVPTARVPLPRERQQNVTAASVPTDPLPAGPAQTTVAAAPPAQPRVKRPRSRRVRLVRAAVFVFILMMILSRISDRMRVEDFVDRIDTIEASELGEVRETLREIGEVPARVRRPLTARLLVLAERPILDFRTEHPTVAKPQWEEARASLALALEMAPGDKRIAARARYVEAQLTRISAYGPPGKIDRARLEEAITQFREAARMDPSSPDPYLGLARIHAYDLRNFDGLMEALAEAEERGYRPTRREHAQIADAYRFRADRAWARARTADAEERLPSLRAAADDYGICADKFDELGSFLESARNAILCRQQAERARLEAERALFGGMFDREDTR
jgi:eukaryotic-like serine/threonine-protein kinase